MTAQFHTVTLQAIAQMIFMASAFLVLLVFSAPSVHAESWSVWKFPDEMNESISKRCRKRLDNPNSRIEFSPSRS